MITRAKISAMRASGGSALIRGRRLLTFFVPDASLIRGRRLIEGSAYSSKYGSTFHLILEVTLTSKLMIFKCQLCQERHEIRCAQSVH